MEPILVTGVGGKVGGIGDKVVDQLLEAGVPVRALAHHENESLQRYRSLGVEVVVGDLTRLGDLHQAIKGVRRLYFGMSVSPQYLEATVNVAAVAKYYGVECLVSMSQMTVSQMSITATTDSPQQKLHWLSEQVLSWSGLPVVTVRPTVFLENPFFSTIAAATIAKSGELRLPFGDAKSSPVATQDVADVVATILLAPAGHIGKIYDLTGPKSETMQEMAVEYSLALAREVRYVDVPLEAWTRELASKGMPPHVTAHIATMAALHRENRYDRWTDDIGKVTGRPATSVRDWVASRRSDFTQARPQ